MSRTLIVLLGVLLGFAGTAVAADGPSGPKVVCGNYAHYKAGNNIIPFGLGQASLYPYRYQQTCPLEQFGKETTIDKVTLSANPSATSGRVSITAYIQIGQGWCCAYNDYIPLTSVTGVYAGTATAVLNPNNGNNEITFEFQVPYKPQGLGDVVIDVIVLATSGNLNGFYFGSTPGMWRVYQNLAGQLVSDNSNLLAEFTVGKK